MGRKHSFGRTTAVVIGAGLIAACVIAQLKPRYWCTASVEFKGRRLPGCVDSASILRFRALADSVHPVVRADAFLGLVATHGLGYGATAVTFVESAFELARQSSVSTPGRNERFGLPLDDADGYLAEALNTAKYDRLSLEERAVRQMAVIDRNRALRMFEEISLPPSPTSTCLDVSVSDGSAYWELATDLSKNGHLPPDLWQEPFMRPITSTMDIRPLTRFIAGGTPSCSLARTRISQLAGELLHLNDSRRSFDTAVVYDDLAKAQFDIVAACRQCTIPDGDFLSAFARFARRRLAEPPCANTAAARAHQEAVAKFRLTLGVDAPVLKVDSAALKPRAPMSTTAAHNEFSLPQFSEALKQLRSLRFRVGSIEFTKAQRRSVEWADAADGLRKYLDSWEVSEAVTDRQIFHQRVIVLGGIVGLAPEGRVKSDAARALVRVLSSPPPSVAPIEWLYHLHSSMPYLGEQMVTAPAAAVQLYGAIQDTQHWRRFNLN